MRGRLKYGIPAAAGLATAGYALSQGEDPGSAILSGVGGTLGGAAGLLGARKLALAGKYLPTEVQEQLLNEAVKTREGGKRQAALLNAAEAAGKVDPRMLGKGIAAATVPAAALTAGLGGVALGAIPGSIGVPGFQQGMAIDPEDPRVSSNTPGAKYSVSPYASTQYM